MSTPPKIDFIRIERELDYSTSRSGGSGGQHVNKVETKVTMHFDIASSAVLTNEQKTILLEKLKNNINKQGKLVLANDSERSQLKNKTKLFSKFKLKITEALIIKKKRKPSKMSKSAKEARLKKKKRNSELKAARRKIYP